MRSKTNAPADLFVQNTLKTLFEVWIRVENAMQPSEDILHPFRRQRPDLLDEVRLIHCQHLGDHDNTRLGQIGFFRLKQYVGRTLRPPEVRGEQTDDCRLNRAMIENVILDDSARMAVATVDQVIIRRFS